MHPLTARRAIILIVSVAAACPAALSSVARAESTMVMAGARGAGPARYDHVVVQRFRPASARTVLVLTPGAHGGAGVFTFLARSLVQRVSDLQVWAVDTREQAFEDATGFATGDPQHALDYYLHGAAINGKTFAPLAPAKVGYMADWGLALLVSDLRQSYAPLMPAVATSSSAATH